MQKTSFEDQRRQLNSGFAEIKKDPQLFAQKYDLLIELLKGEDLIRNDVRELVANKARELEGLANQRLSDYMAELKKRNKTIFKNQQIFKQGGLLTTKSKKITEKTWYFFSPYNKNTLLAFSFKRVFLIPMIFLIYHNSKHPCFFISLLCNCLGASHQAPYKRVFLVSRGRFELPTQGFSVLCSDRLSYLNRCRIARKINTRCLFFCALVTSLFEIFWPSENGVICYRCFSF